MITHPRFALVRGLPRSFAQALSQEKPIEPIQLELALLQHELYTKTLADCVDELIEIEADEAHPDCCFVEDTVIVVEHKAIITRIGAPSRQAESQRVRATLESLQKTHPYLTLHSLEAPAQLDGGDVLQIGGKVFVGLSKRSNQAAVEQLARILPGRVFAIPVTHGLHLKSLLSAVDAETLLVADSPAGHAMAAEIVKAFGSQPPRCLYVPDAVAANVLRVGSTLIIQEGFPRSEKMLAELAEEKGLQLRKLTMSELIKADGALTCCSVLF